MGSDRRRSRAAELPDWDAELLGLVGEVGVDARAREVHHARRRDSQHFIIALEGHCAAVFHPIRCEADPRYVAVRGPERRNLLGALRRLAVHLHHAGVLFVHLVELGPAQLDVKVMRSCWHERLLLGTASVSAYGAVEGRKPSATSIDPRRVIERSSTSFALTTPSPYAHDDFWRSRCTSDDALNLRWSVLTAIRSVNREHGARIRTMRSALPFAENPTHPGREVAI